MQEDKLRRGEAATFFDDEFRSPTMVSDLTGTVAWLLSGGEAAAAAVKRVFNIGGPDRLSRFEMAEAVAAHCGLLATAVARGKSADVARAAASPLDISMDSAALQELLPFPLTPFKVGLRDVFGPAVDGAADGGAVGGGGGG